MSLSLLGIFRWGGESYTDIDKKNYLWLGWTYLMSKQKVNKIQNRVFDLYCYNPENEDYGHSSDALLKLTCEELIYNKDGMGFPDKNSDRSFIDDLDDYNDGRKWRCWVKIIKAEAITNSLNNLRKESDGKPPHPQGAQNNFIYLID
jgi:hypothetical protein